MGWMKACETERPCRERTQQDEPAAVSLRVVRRRRQQAETAVTTRASRQRVRRLTAPRGRQQAWLVAAALCLTRVPRLAALAREAAKLVSVTQPARGRGLMCQRPFRPQAPKARLAPANRAMELNLPVSVE